MVIISPESMEARDKQYFDRIRKALAYDIEYWWFDNSQASLIMEIMT